MASACRPVRCARRWRRNCRSSTRCVMIGGDAADGRAALGRAAPQKPLFRASLKADAIAASQLIGRPVLAFAGIAQPEKFFATLAGVGAQVVETAVFPDHWPFRAARDRAPVPRAPRARGLTLVCTEKDHVRLPAEFVEDGAGAAGDARLRGRRRRSPRGSTAIAAADVPCGM